MIFQAADSKRKHIFRLSVFVLITLFILVMVDILISISYSHTSRIKRDSYYAYDTLGPITPTSTDRRIALTFDDGPHPKYTRQIMHTLKKNDVPATFFFLGRNITKYKNVVKEVSDAGFEIGNHTYTHSENVHMSAARLEWELNTTNFLIENITGRSTKLYRPPFLLDMGPEVIINKEAPEQPLLWAANINYLPLGVDVDTKDFEATSKEELFENIEREISKGRVILLHDGTRKAHYTAEYLDEIISRLKEKDYEFVFASELVGLDRGEAMPIASGATGVRNGIHTTFITSIENVRALFFIVSVIAIVLAIIRMAGVVNLRFLFNRKKRGAIQKNMVKRNVTVLIPAYNEEANIESTLLSIIHNEYGIGEIIVIDDGSTDNTATIVQSVIDKKLGNVVLLCKQNSGKAAALNYAIRRAKGGIIICLDADTVFDKYAIRNLVRHFADKQVGGVAGRVEVANTHTLLGKFQNIEYTIGQNMEKEALFPINAIGVVPGAISAWRKSAIIACGGYSSDTLVEDQDLTLAILARGYKIIYDSKSVSYTEAPEQIKDFLKQRFRWVFGTLQCFWKYRTYIGSTKRPSLGFIILPNIAIYNTILPIVSSIIDIIVVVMLVRGSWQAALTGYVIFTILDALYAMLAFYPKRLTFKLLITIPLQRIFYRQLLLYVLIKSIIKVIEGSHALWNKLKRQGSAQKFYIDNIQKPASATD